MRRLFVAMLLVSFISNGAFASAVWVGPTGSWSNATLWNPQNVPDDTTEIKITTNGSVCTVDSAVGTYTAQKISIASGPDGATLEIVSGGSIGEGRELNVGAAGATGDGSIGYLHQTGGTLTITSSGKLEIGYKAGGEGYYTISGGTLSGGEGRLFVGGAGAAGSIGTVTVIGSDASISLDKMYLGSQDSATPAKYPGTATLEYQIGSAGVSPINVNSAYIDKGGDSSTVALVLSLIGEPPAETDIPLINGTVDGTFDTVNGSAYAAGDVITLSYGGTDYYYKLVYSSLTLEWVPEPATMLLLGLGGLFAVRKRK